MSEEKKDTFKGETSVRTNSFRRNKECLQYSDVDLSPECFPPPIFTQKTFHRFDHEVGSSERMEYWSAPLIHKTRDRNGNLRTDRNFEVEGPMLTSDRGIELSYRDGKYRASCPVAHDIQDEEMKKFCGTYIELETFSALPEKHEHDMEGKDSFGFWTQLYLRCLGYVFDQRGNIDYFTRNIHKLERLEGLFRNPLKWKFDYCGNLEGCESPFKWYKILLKGDITHPNHEKAPFIIPVRKSPKNKKGQLTLEWSRLQNVELKFKPVLRFTNICYMGGNFTIGCQIVSAVVYGFTKNSLICRQEATLTQARQDEDLLDDLEDQLQESINDQDGNKLKIYGKGEVVEFTKELPAVIDVLKDEEPLVISNKVCSMIKRAIDEEDLE